MRLTRASSYALHALAYLAAQRKDAAAASHVIAQKRGIPKRFLLKVLKPLVEARILLSLKGPNGGYRLARSANDVSLLEVIEAIDGPIEGHAPSGRQEAGAHLNRRLEQICSHAAEQVRKQLGKIKITELSFRD